MTIRITSTLTLLLSAIFLSCGGGHDDAGHDHGDGGHTHGSETAAHAEEETWAVTSWGEHFEIFAESDPYNAGQTVKSHTHVTILDGFLPLTEGTVSAILRPDAGADQVFSRDAALRAGIFSIEITPNAPGEYELIFRVSGAGRVEDIPSGRVRVGGPDWVGAIVETPPHPGGMAASSAGSSSAIGFLKEQQWKTAFATQWTSERSLGRAVGGPGRVRGAGAGDIVVSAPANGIVAADPVVHVGLAVRAGETLMRLQPRAGSDQSISELRSELSLARSRLARLEKLLDVGAVSAAEVESARARVATLAPLVESPDRAEHLTVASPLTGRVADVWAMPGRAVEAGDSLLRVVKTSPVWVEIALDPADAEILKDGASMLHIRTPGSREPINFAPPSARLIAIAPALHQVTGKVTALFEVTDSLERLRIGSTVNAEVSTDVADSGVVVPTSSLVEDGGATIVYVQVDGESFERHEIQVATTAGGYAIVNGLTPGQRLVTRGGAMIRRASLLSSGRIEGHVH